MTTIYQGNLNKMSQGAVTLLDILGWTGIWQRKSDAIESLLALLDKMESKVDAFTDIEKSKKRAKFRDLTVEIKSISDTIALVTYGECTSSLEFHAIITSIIVGSSLIKGIPVRGATCYGYFTSKDNIMVGPAIDEVASWYEIAEWIGVIQTPSAFYQTKIEDFNYKNLRTLINYEVPIKQFGKILTFCSNWPYIWNLNKRNKGDLLKVFLDMSPIIPAIGIKFSNTLKYYDYLMKDESSVFSSNPLSAPTKE